MLYEWMATKVAILVTKIKVGRSVCGTCTLGHVLDCVKVAPTLQVGWRRSGLGLWSPSGCRLMCSLRQSARSTGGTVTPTGMAGEGRMAMGGLHALESGVTLVTWGAQGYRLIVAETGSSCQVAAT